MARFKRAEVTSLELSGHGTVRDVARMMFSAHRAITEVEVLAAAPRPGWFTVRFATERGDAFQWAQARTNCEDWFAERVANNVSFVIEELPREVRAGEQMGLLGG